MADVTLSYKGSDILELSNSGSATLKTGGKYCEDDIAVEYVKPSGGGGDDSNGLVDLVFDYTSSDGHTWSGVVEDNTVKRYSVSSFCSPPLILKKPIILATNDIVTIKITNSTGFFANVGFTHPYDIYSARTHPTIIVADNVSLYTNTFNYTYTGNGVVVNGLFIYPRTSNQSNIASTKVSLSINDVLIF